VAATETTTLRVWRNFVRAKAEVGRALHRELREAGLTGAQLAILRVLAEADSEGIQLNEVSHRLYVSSANVTGLTDRLEEAGHLKRVPHPEDRRITLAVLTPTGRRLFEQIYPAHLARIKQLMSALTPQEQGLLSDLLERIADQAARME
jgi:MarR family 2-MHQ and catechol resistance regulon transcriptional repressor